MDRLGRAARAQDLARGRDEFEIQLDRRSLDHIRTVARYRSPMELTSLPGHELVLKGLDDLARGVESEEALLVSIGAPRLRGAGIDVPEPLAVPEHRLYELLAAEDEDSAHSRYNALVRRLVGFERAADALAR